MRFYILLALPLLLGACTQSSPAQIVHRGNESLSRGSGNSVGWIGGPTTSSYSTSAPSSGITSSDLPPPSKMRTHDKQVDNVTHNTKNILSFLDKKPLTASDRNPSGLIWPVEGQVVSSFGPKGGGLVNDGINIAARANEPVYAAASGEAVYVGNEVKGYGTMVMLKHAGGRTTTYAHLSRAYVEKYERVKQGEVIGYVGQTGNIESPQLHFAVHEGKEPVDPEGLLSSRVASLPISRN